MSSFAKRVLVLFAHPALQHSMVNRRLLKAAEGVPGVTVHDLYETYPTMIVNAPREQALLLEHDVIVFQHPFYWYSAPALIKEWTDHVLAHGWAYGEGAAALRGKSMMVAITTGGPAEAYQAEGRNRYTIRQLLAPQDQTAHLCSMQFLPPFVVHNAKTMKSNEIAEAAARYARALTALRDDSLSPEALRTAAEVSELIPHA